MSSETDKVEKTPNKKFPIIGDNSVLQIKLITLVALIGSIISGAIVFNNLTNKVDTIAASQSEMKSDFKDLCDALGVHRFGRNTP